MWADGCGPWTGEALAAIDEAARKLLAEVGVGVSSPTVRETLLKAGGEPGAGDRIKLPRAVVAAALEACPERFVMAARCPDNDLVIDPHPGPVYGHNTGETAITLDPVTAQPSPSTFAGQVAAARVMHHMRYLRSMNPLLSPQDVPGSLTPLYSYLALATQTDKVVNGPGVSEPGQVSYLIRMADIVAGAAGRDARPLAIYFSPVSPVRLGGDVTEALMLGADAGVVCQVLPAPTAGTTAPVVLSAALAQQHAEVLAGVVAVQAVSPGTPCFYGPRLHASDPQMGSAVWGTPVLGLCAAGATLLARGVGLASDCYGLATDAKVIDAQNGYECALNGMLAAAARPRYLSGYGSLHTVVATSFEQLEVDDEMLGYIEFALAERPWDAEALDGQTLAEGVQAGNFLAARQTRKYLRREACPTRISFHGGLNEWQEKGRTGVLDAARERLHEHLATETPGLPGDAEEQLCALIDEAARDLGLAEWPDPRRLLEEARQQLATFANR